MHPVAYGSRMKDIKYTVAIAPRKTNASDEFLAVRRPHDDKDLADSWGLPAITLLPGELPEEGAIRACREKLGCTAKPTRLLGIMYQKRNAYDIFLMDIEMVLADGETADVAKANTKNTAYTAQQWTSDPTVLMDSARHGSCCASIFLTDRGLFDRSEWIESLEGSGIVG